MYISIIGSPGCGKSTLFTALTSLTPDNRPGADAVAVIDVADERVDRLAAIFNPRKKVYARITVADTAGIEEGDVRKETVSAKMIQEMRENDAFLLVLRGFGSGGPADPRAEFLTIFQEFMLADIIQIETRLERIRKQAGKKESTALAQEEASLTVCLDHLNAGHPLATLDFSGQDERQLRGFRFLSQKPIMVVVNAEEGASTDPGAIPDDLRAAPDDRASFMAEFGITQSVAGRLIRLAFDTLGLISFLTVGDDECRAWPIRRGMNAQEAAGVIHTDLSQKFIRAETVSYDDFMQHGGFAGCKKAGVWRLEGKTYIVRDGDILSIRAGN
jgi:ribosome-binding ATPase YchF (GTP1/OBG family)